MKKAMPWIIAVAIGYGLVIGALLYLVPSPWNYVGAVIILLMAARFAFSIQRVTKLGSSRIARK